jgi:hypothetical protein
MREEGQSESYADSLALTKKVQETEEIPHTKPTEHNNTITGFCSSNIPLPPQKKEQDNRFKGDFNKPTQNRYLMLCPSCT